MADATLLILCKAFECSRSKANRSSEPFIEDACKGFAGVVSRVKTGVAVEQAENYCIGDGSERGGVLKDQD